MYDSYLNVVQLLPRIHRLFMDVIKIDLEELSIYEINNVQSIMLFHISSIPSFYTTENIPLNDLHPDTVSAKRAMRGDSLCSGMVGINS